MSQPFFSIIIPTYNRQELIYKAISSVLSQTYESWELLICDDASTDNTEGVVLSIADPRIKFLKLNSNQGNAAARNLGVKNAKYEWITFLDSDDSYDENYLESFANSIATSNHKFFFCGYRIKEDDKIIKNYIWQPPSDSRGSFIKDLKIGIGCGVVIHQSCFEEVGLFDASLRVAVDTDFLIRLEQKFSFQILPSTHITINQHKGNRVRKNTLKLAEAYEIIINKHKELIQSDTSLIQRWYYKLMWLQFHSGNNKAGNRAYYELKKNNLTTTKAYMLKLMFNLSPNALAIRLHKLLGR